MNKHSVEVNAVAGSFQPDNILKAAGSDLLCDLDLTNDELGYLLDLADEVKRAPGNYADAMGGKSIGMLFEKPSLRTKLTFELAISQMGGASVFCEGPIGVREPLKDVARNLDRWVNGIVALEELEAEDSEFIQGILRKHQDYTGSTVAGALLKDWEKAAKQ